MKVKELLENYEGRFAICSGYGYELVYSGYSFDALVYSNGVNGLLQILDAEVAEFNFKNYYNHKNTLVIKIKEEALQNEAPDNKLQQGAESIEEESLDNKLQQGAESIEEESLNDAAVLKAALDDFVAAVEKMSTDENSIPELTAAIVVLYAIYKDIDRNGQ